MEDGLVGRVVAGYRVEHVVGRGGMGVVYRATEVGLDRTVALKVIAPELAQDEGFRDRFVAESRTAAKLDHPNIVPVFHAGEDDGLLFIAMRFVAGEDLKTLMRREGPLDPGRVVAIVCKVASALDEAHRRRLVHRDVKPANVLLAEGDYAYLSDFGLTKQAEVSSAATRTGQVLGTLDYLAPEQANGGQIGPWTDVYALGALLFHALTGSVPFPADTDAAKLLAHASRPPPRPSEVRPDLPQSFDKVVAIAMAKDPHRRHTSAGALAEAALAAAEQNTRRPAWRMTSRARAIPASRSVLVVEALRQPFNLALAVAVFAAGAAFGGVLAGVLLAAALYGAGVLVSYRESIGDERRRATLSRADELGLTRPISRARR